MSLVFAFLLNYFLAVPHDACSLSMREMEIALRELYKNGVIAPQDSVVYVDFGPVLPKAQHFHSFVAEGKEIQVVDSLSMQLYPRITFVRDIYSTHKQYDIVLKLTAEAVGASYQGDIIFNCKSGRPEFRTYNVNKVE